MHSTINFAQAFACSAHPHQHDDHHSATTTTTTTTTTSKAATAGKHGSHPSSPTASANSEDSGTPCPLSSTCKLAPGTGVIDHLTSVHQVSQYDVEVGKDGAGEVQTTATVWISHRRRYSAMLLHYHGTVFLWSMETRARADAETQVSAVVQVIRQPSSTPASPASPSTPFLLYGSGNNNNMDEEMSPASQLAQQRYRVKLSVGFPNTAAAAASSNTATTSNSASNGNDDSDGDVEMLDRSDNEGASTSSSSSRATKSTTTTSLTPSPWQTEMVEGPVQPGKEHICHETLISHGKGVVVLYPTHQSLFQAAPADAASAAEQVSQIHFTTRIERMRSDEFF